jgi:putative DNA primase/helicase
MARERAEKHHKGKLEAIRLFETTAPVTDTLQHPYLIKKKIQPHNTRLMNTVLYVPIYDTSLELCSIQFIQADGKKSFLTGGKISGCFNVIGELKQPTDKILLAEGFATGASLYEDTGDFTVCSFSANNLESVAKTFKAFYPQARFIICGDNDLNGVGQAAAEKAANAIGCSFIVPEQAGMDFNDVFNLEG